MFQVSSCCLRYIPRTRSSLRFWTSWALKVDQIFLWRTGIFQGSQLCIPASSFCLKILEKLHNMGHLAKNGLSNWWLKSYYWPSLRRDVNGLVSHYHLCHLTKGYATNAGLYLSLPIPTQPWTNVSMDFVLAHPDTAWFWFHICCGWLFFQNAHFLIRLVMSLRPRNCIFVMSIAFMVYLQVLYLTTTLILLVIFGAACSAWLIPLSILAWPIILRRTARPG